MSVKFCLAAFLLGSLGLTACNRNPQAAPAQDAAKTTTDINPKVEPETAQDKSLKDAVRAFHQGLASSDPEGQKKALTAILCTRKDIEVMFPGQEQFWGVLEIGLMGQMDDVASYAKDAAARGAIKSIATVDLRHRGDSDATTVVSKIAKDLPAYRANIECEKDQVRLEPLVFVNNRWVWYPGLEKISAALPAAETK